VPIRLFAIRLEESYYKTTLAPAESDVNEIHFDDRGTERLKPAW